MRKLHTLLTSDALHETYPMHMPGHKRVSAFGGGLPVTEDVTEVEGFDDLHEPTGVLRELGERFARLYHANCAFPLVNGSTCGILAAVRALTRYGDRILMARNCHRSVYHAAELCGLDVTYLLPDVCDGIFSDVTPESVGAALDADPKIRLVVVTSPTYEGVVSDICGIARLVHERGIPLLVDAAHGAHLGFSEEFPENPFTAGADVAVMSLHKTLPALTQTALLLSRGQYAAGICRELDVFETSSPSYLLLESAENCAEILETGREQLFSAYARRLSRFRQRATAWKHLRLFSGEGCFAVDSGKLVILTGGTPLTGPALADILRRNHIETEMSYPGYVLCMTSICDTDEGFDRLSHALDEIDRTLCSAVGTSSWEDAIRFLPKRRMTAAAARDRETQTVSLGGAVGRVAGEYVFAYPPGIPLTVPGEVVDERLPEVIRRLEFAGVRVRSTSGQLPEKILTLLDKNS